MALDPEYREMIENAQKAIRPLLAGSTDDSWVWLRGGLRELRETLEADEFETKLRQHREDFHRRWEHLKAQRREIRPLKPSVAGTEDRTRDEHHRLKGAWMAKPIAFREGAIIEALGEGHMTVRELTDAVNAKLDWGSERVLYESSVASIVRRLWKSGQLDRVGEPIGQRRVGYRYFVKREISGTVAELERAFHSDAEEA